MYMIHILPSNHISYLTSPRVSLGDLTKLNKETGMRAISEYIIN